MDEEKIMFDKDEIVFTDTSINPPVLHDLPASKITSITFSDGFAKGAFGIKKKTRVISIEAVGITKPLELFECKEIAFEKYVRLLTEFAEKNKIALRNNFAA